MDAREKNWFDRFERWVWISVGLAFFTWVIWPAPPTDTKIVAAIIAKQSLASVIQLIDSGADVNGMTENGEYPLLMAAQFGNANLVAILLSNGAEVNPPNIPQRSYSPLHKAAFWGYEECAKLLIEAGSNLDALDLDGRTPLHESASQGNAEITKLLISSGAKVNMKDESGESALHDASWGYLSGAFLILVESGSEISALNDRGYSPLHCAAYALRPEYVKLLLEKGADPNAENLDGDKPFDLAKNQDTGYKKYNRQLETLKILEPITH